jgi:glyoxylase-like metal-dependent hydrolase (beta-lactamase superfamily II)
LGRATASPTISATSPSPDFAICRTCGTQFGEPSPPRCPICEDERQYVPAGGQQWTSLAALRESHGNWIRDDGGFTGIGTEPSFAIGQRALLVPWRGSNVMWDCISLLDDETADEVGVAGGLAAIAISHPHYYSSLVEWAQRFDCPVYLHADDAEWLMRPDDRVVLWQGETHELGDGLTLVRCGGHFAGGQVLHVADRNALLSGDIVQVIPDRRWVSFMYSYPNLVPLGEAAVRRIVAALEPFPFDSIHGAWWGRVVEHDGSEIVRRSAERYISAIRGDAV